MNSKSINKPINYKLTTERQINLLIKQNELSNYHKNNRDKFFLKYNLYYLIVECWNEGPLKNKCLPWAGVPDTPE